MSSRSPGRTELGEPGLVRSPCRLDDTRQATAGRTPERFVEIDGVRNFRDLGGYPAAAGGIVRWGRVYRSASLAGATETGLTTLGSLGIRTVVDLRTSAERGQTALAGGVSELGCAVAHLPLVVDPSPIPAPAAAAAGDRPSVVEQILDRAARGEWPRPRVERALQVAGAVAARAAGASYRSMLAANRVAFRSLLTLLSEPANLPAVVHCAAGKDRTGVVVAVLLSALGVPRESVTQDYLLSNRCWAQVEAEPDARRLLDGGLSPQSATALFGVAASTLEELFAALDDEHGGVDAFLTTVCRVRPPVLARLRETLTLSP